MHYFVKTPNIIKRLFPKLIWNYKTDDNVIYLTFDDGPTPEITDWVLDVLNQYNAKATFFCIGKNITSNPNILNRINSNGHRIGNHTNYHLNNWKTSKTTYLKDVEQTTTILEKHINCDVNKRLFRPPYGKITPHTAKKLHALGYNIIMWDVLSADFDQTISPETCLHNVLHNTTNGSIVVFHDSVKAFQNLQYCLPKTLDYFSEKGFKFEVLPA
ncbi:MAG: polysaccharide deacetylase family protein [Flavobacteriaceae bacterium]